MKQRPSWFIILALMYFAIAAAMPAQTMFIYGHGFDEFEAVLEKLTILNWLVMFAAVACGFLVWQASPYLPQIIPAFIVLVAVNNLFVGYYSTDFSPWTTTFATLGLVFLNSPLLSPKLQWLLVHPEKRWWIRAERRRVAVPIAIEGTRLHSSRGETFDVSLSGAFVPAANGVSVGDWITLRMKFGTFTQIRCQARVVRRSEAKGIYPAGVGVQFVNMSRREKRELRRCLEKSDAQIL